MPRGGRRLGAGRRTGKPATWARIEARSDQPSVTELCMALLPRCLATLVTIMERESASDSARVRAAEALIDRGFGKPLSATEVAQQRVAQAAPARRFVIALYRDGQLVRESGDPGDG